MMRVGFMLNVAAAMFVTFYMLGYGQWLLR
jgi:hypothetical protein